MNEKEAKKEENTTKNDIDNMNNNNNTSGKYLLPPKSEDKMCLKTLVLDLDETLAHGQNIPFSSSKNQMKFECILNNIKSTIYFKIRPGVREFLRKMCKLYEIVIFTASVEDYAKPLIDLIDIKKVCSYKLYRDQCTCEKLIFIKDLKKLGRDLKDVIIIDNSPNAYSWNKENGIPISTWIEDENDRELFDLVQILEFLSNVEDVRVFIPKFVIGDEISYFASMDIIRKYQSFNGKNNNMSAINFHPYMNDSEINSNQITEVNNYSINVESPINREENIEDNEESKHIKDELDKKEKDLIETPENLFDDIILNDNINRTDFDININEDMNLLSNEKDENNVENKNNINNDKNGVKINKDKKNTDEINNSKEKKENSIIKKSKEKITTNKKDENKITKNISSKNIKDKKKSKAKTLQKNHNIKKIKHNKSSSLSINNTISNFDLLMPIHKSKKENISKNKNKMNLTIKNIKSKTVKRPKKITLEDKSKKRAYRPRNIITEFKPLKMLNNSINGNIKSKNNLNLISYTPKKGKNENKLKNRILNEISQRKEKKEKSKIKEEIKLNKNIKGQNNNNPEVNKKELIKQRKKTPFRVHQKKIKQNNISKINNNILKELDEKEKDNKIINYRNKIVDKETGNIKKENISLIKSKNKESTTKIDIKNNHKGAKSTKNFHFKNHNIKKVENRLPWGWGGYTIKLSDFDNIFNYNVESREIRIAKLELDTFKRAKSYKPKKIEKNKERKESKDNNVKLKHEKSSSNSINLTMNMTDNNK